MCTSFIKFFFCMPSFVIYFVHSYSNPTLPTFFFFFVFQDTGSSYLFIPSLIPATESHHVDLREIVMVDVGAEKRRDFGHYGGHHAGHNMGLRLGVDMRSATSLRINFTAGGAGTAH